VTLQAVSLTNFKCFVDLRLELAPLTLLSGYNSAGKSTVLQAIILLAQGLRSDRSAQHLPLNGPLMRLGTAGDVLSNRANGTKIIITVANKKGEIEWQFDTLGPKTGALKVEEATLRITGKSEVSWTDHLWEGGPSAKPYDLINMLENVICISAVRAGTAEAFPVPDDVRLVHADVGNEGQYAPWWYATNTDNEIDKMRRHPNEKAVTLRRQLDAYLGDLFPGALATADEITKTSLVRLGLRTGTASDWQRPVNIGYGLTYAFPLLVALLLARKGQIVVIDSPEAHLHPRAQSIMGGMLTHFISSGVQILVETHSDHLLNGVRLAVKRKTIKPKNVAIHFFSGVDENGAHGIITPRIDTEGNIDYWPTGFFDQAESDLGVLAGWE